MSSLDGKLLIVTSSPGGSDLIYIGIGEQDGLFLRLSKASMIVRYEEVGVSGLSSNPSKATRLRPVTGGDGEVYIPFSSISAIVVADLDAWEVHLSTSKG